MKGRLGRVNGRAAYFFLGGGMHICIYTCRVHTCMLHVTIWIVDRRDICTYKRVCVCACIKRLTLTCTIYCYIPRLRYIYRYIAHACHSESSADRPTVSVGLAITITFARPLPIRLDPEVCTCIYRCWVYTVHRYG